MRLIEEGVLCPAEQGGVRAICTFPSVAVLESGELLATYRTGSGKDSTDETVELRRSQDGGRRWSEPCWRFSTDLDGRAGSLRVAYITPLGGDRLMACGMWIDRLAYPEQPLFNPETEGCLPAAIVVAESSDHGRTWPEWRQVPVAKDVGPPSLTNPVLLLADGRLAISIESNKNYEDLAPWQQKVVYVCSEDGGKSWKEPRMVCRDPAGRLFYWDQRAAVAPDGRVATFSWVYDQVEQRYLNVHRRISADSGRTWSMARDLGFADQPSHPAILPDGRVALAWVDRFGTRSIRARLAERIDADFAAGTEVVLYEAGAARLAAGSTAETLADMQTWNYGLPFAEALPDGAVLVVYYAGTSQAMEIRWARLTAA